MTDKDLLRELQAKAAEMLDKKEMGRYEKVHKQIMALLKRNPSWQSRSLLRH